MAPTQRLPTGLRQQVTRSAGRCQRKLCEHYDGCFAYRRRAAGARAQILLVNYALLFADLNLRVASDDAAFILPLPLRQIEVPSGVPDVPPIKQWVLNGERVAIIADEAHELEDAARSAFTDSITLRQIKNQLDRVSALTKDAEDPLGLWEALVHTAQKAAETFFGDFQPLLRKRAKDKDEDDALPLEDERDAVAPLREALATLADEVEQADGAWLKKREDQVDWYQLPEHLDRLRESLKNVAHGGTKRARRHVRTARLERGAVVLEAVRTDVSPQLRARLWKPFHAVIATSATLTAKDGFASFRRRTGCNRGPADKASDRKGGVQLVDVPSPFHYPEAGLLFVPKDAMLYDPKAYDEIARLREWWASWMIRLVEAAGGGAFLLFTSYADMRAVHGIVAPRLGRDFQLLLQDLDDASPSRLLPIFQADGNAVLFGVRSCWQGLDVPGPALRLVVINRVPYPARSLLNDARSAVVTARGGSPFRELTYYDAAILLKQGVGRLHRRMDDRGVVALLDRRLQMPGDAAHELLELLPALPRTSSWKRTCAYLEVLRDGGEIT